MKPNKVKVIRLGKEIEVDKQIILWRKRKRKELAKKKSLEEKALAVDAPHPILRNIFE